MITSLDQTSPQIRRNWYALQDVFNWVFFSSFFFSIFIGLGCWCTLTAVFWWISMYILTFMPLQMMIIAVKLFSFNSIASFIISVKLEMPKDPLKRIITVSSQESTRYMKCSVVFRYIDDPRRHYFLGIIHLCPEMQVNEIQCSLCQSISVSF